jgi:beta-1,4-mannosyltransferase
MREQQTRRVAIVVLDEIGQSPRMQLHARALVDRGIPVDIICYAGDVTPEWVRNHPLIFLWPLPAPGWTGRHRLPRALFSLYTVFRGARITINLFWTLMFRISPPNFFLIQTPPPVPTLPLCLLAAKIRGAATIIDWHNYGHSILALRLGERHWMVRLTLWVERVFSRQATHHLCVSRAMQADLATRWGCVGAL